MITVCIPVGPSEANKQWLRECLDSIAAQTMAPYDILLIDDGAQLYQLDWLRAHEGEYSQWSVGSADYLNGEPNYIETRIYVMPWRTGISHAFNYGVALATTECVFLLGSDDTLGPNCLERCWEAYQKRKEQPAYYSVPVRYLSTGDIQTIPCNAAMVTKSFFRQTGGFPIETALGAGDAALLSICMNRPELPVVWVGEETGYPDEPLYNYRDHPDTHTHKLDKWWPIVNEIRNILTRDWSADEIAKWSNNYE